MDLEAATGLGKCTSGCIFDPRTELNNLYMGFKPEALVWVMVKCMCEGLIAGHAIGVGSLGTVSDTCLLCFSFALPGGGHGSLHHTLPARVD